MKMDHALRLAAAQVAQPDEILSMAGRLSGQGPLLPSQLPTATTAMATPAPPDTPGNVMTLRACQSLLSRTIALLE
jgi:hypothetical protein